MNGIANLSRAFKERYDARREEHISFDEYLDRCKADPATYETPHGRLCRAIGKPKIIETAKDERLGRIFENRVIRLYPAFSDFYGVENGIEELMTVLELASQGGEMEKQIPFLMGPVSGGKSSVVERCKERFETVPFYALVDEQGVLSPIFESPLGLFCEAANRAMLEKEYKVDPRFIPTIRSRWVQKRLNACGGDFTKFKVARLYPSVVNQIGIAETTPADENTQDVSTLVGKTDIRALDELVQSDPDAYVYSGALCVSSQGVFDFVEIHKVKVTMLNPLLTATQEHRFDASERIGALPYNGVILAHSNQSEWEKFRNNPDNAALASRTKLIRFPYCLRVSEAVKIFEKKLAHTAYKGAACAPGTLEIAAKLSVLCALAPFQGSPITVKMRVYNGENLRDKDIDAKPINEYRKAAGVEEGMMGMDMRLLYKAIERTFFYDPYEVSANPVTLLRVLEEDIRKEFSEKVRDRYLAFLEDPLANDLFERIGKDLREAYFSTQGGEYAQNLFQRYFWYADHWIENKDYRDPKTGTLLKRKDLEKELERIEKPASIANPKDFRNEVVRWIWKNKSIDTFPDRSSFPKLNEAVEKVAFPSFDEFLPILARKTQGTSEQTEQYNAFLAAMVKKGYTPSMVELLGEWWHRKKAGG